MKNTILCLFTLGFSLAALSADPVYNYKLLKDRRDKLVLPAYTQENRQLIVAQARLILSDVFVHRALKLEDFGSQIDPLPKLDLLASNMSNLDTASFHGLMREIFQSQRDLHTSYQLSYPYICYRSLIPVEFKEAIGLDGIKKISVGKILSAEEIIKVIPDLSVLDKIQVGDVLLEYNGEKIADVLQKLETDSGGANPAANRREAIMNIGFVSQKGRVAPVQDDIVLKLQNRFGKIYSVTLPWISKENETCLKDNKPAVSLKLPMAQNDERNELNEIFRQTKKSANSNKIFASDWKTTAESILRYKIINNEYGKFGVFDLDSFSPATLGVDELIDVFKKVLENDFAKVDGIIIDLRDNGGGYISLAEGLVELFNAQNTQPAGFRLRATPATSHYVTGTMGETNEFRTALEAAMASGAYYTEPKQIDTTAGMNKRGQSFFRPVALFTNANCYSSCDLFSGLMQDHGAAVIFGEDPNTGAGGANNVQLADVLKQLGPEKPGPFKKLPYGQNIGFAFRQMVRVLSHSGELIEDVGVKSDLIAEPKISDLYTESADQFKIISKKLNEISAKYVSSVKLKSDQRQDLIKNMTPSLFAAWEQTSDLIIRVDGKDIGEEKIELDNLQGREVLIGDGIDTSSFKLGDFEVLGMLDGKRVWRKMVSYRVIPSSTPLAKEGLSLDFSSTVTPFTFYTTKPNEGWNIRDGVMTVGSGKYADNMHTEAGLFVVLSKEAKKLTFDAQVKSEKGFDYLQVLAVVEGKETALIEKISGDVPMKTYEVDLSPYAGKKVEFRFVFDADDGVNDEGPKVDNFKIQ